jgi:hypothetical protein
MMKVLEDKDYGCDIKNSAFINGTLPVNRHATTLVLACLIKLLDSVIPLLDSCCDDLQNKKYDKITSTLIKRIYV